MRRGGIARGYSGILVVGYSVKWRHSGRSQKSVISEVHVVRDLMNGPYVTETESDLVWSCEFVEHMEEQHIERFLIIFRFNRNFIMLTYTFSRSTGLASHQLSNAERLDR